MALKCNLADDEQTHQIICYYIGEIAVIVAVAAAINESNSNLKYFICISLKTAIKNLQKVH